MPTKAKFYVYGVMAAGAAAIGISMADAAWPQTLGYALFLAIAVLSSVVKLRLPGLPGTFSVNFLILLFGLLHFDAAPVLIAGAVSGLAQSVLNTKKRPTPVQIGFNMANIALSLSASVLAYRALIQHQILFRPALLALSAAVYFVVNTGLVSCILSILQGKPLAEVSEEWYSWSYPYFLIGAALLGFLPRSGEKMLGAEAWLVVLPLLYLVHFFYGLSMGKRPDATPSSDEAAAAPSLPLAARLFIGLAGGLGIAVLAYAVAHWTSADPLRFAAGRAEHRKCPFGYAPFGAGQHFCLGFAFAEMQVKLIMHHLLRRFRWQLPTGYRVEFASIPIQHPKDGLPIVLETV